MNTDRARLRAGRISVAIAIGLVAIGVLRLITDTLHEIDPEYWRPLAGTPWRYLVRAPSDGSVLGDLNAQFFKLLGVPAGVSLIWLDHRFGSGTFEEKAKGFRDPIVRGVWIACFVAGFTLIELDKQYDVFGMSTVMVDGERGWLNHVTHIVSGVLAWFGLGALRFEPLRQADLDLEHELEALAGDTPEPADLANQGTKIRPGA